MTMTDELLVFKGHNYLATMSARLLINAATGEFSAPGLSRWVADTEIVELATGRSRICRVETAHVLDAKRRIGSFEQELFGDWLAAAADRAAYLDAVLGFLLAKCANLPTIPIPRVSVRVGSKFKGLEPDVDITELVKRGIVRAEASFR
jgi:hypothetical protein